MNITKKPIYGESKKRHYALAQEALNWCDQVRDVLSQVRSDIDQTAHAIHPSDLHHIIGELEVIRDELQSIFEDRE